MLESISESGVFEVVKRNIVDILEEVDEGLVTRDKALVDLGANSLDRADIVTGSMEDLGLSFPMRELAKIANIDDLVGFLYSKATEG